VANLVRKFVYRNGKTVRLLIIFDEMEKNHIQKLVRSKSERVTFEANSGEITIVKYGSGSVFSAPRDFNRSITCMNENYHALTGVWQEPD
jgi:ribonuclease HIII